MRLEKIRLRINSIDAQIISLLIKRQKLMLAVGTYKKENRLPIHQPRREAEILRKLGRMARAEGISPALVRKIFMAIFRDSKRIQKKS
jgi:chorismate mutase